MADAPIHMMALTLKQHTALAERRGGRPVTDSPTSIKSKNAVRQRQHGRASVLDRYVGQSNA